jgi:hypothetical protein
MLINREIHMDVKSLAFIGNPRRVLQRRKTDVLPRISDNEFLKEAAGRLRRSSLRSY